VSGIMDKVGHAFYIFLYWLERFSDKISSHKVKRSNNKNIKDEKPEDITEKILERISRFSYKYLIHIGILRTNSFINKYIIFFCNDSCFKFTEKFSGDDFFIKWYTFTTMFVDNGSTFINGKYGYSYSRTKVFSPSFSLWLMIFHPLHLGAKASA
jgi:hypothetical protein